MKIASDFQKYTKYDPLVPVWNLTQGIPGCIHRFFDSSSISPSGRYVAVFQLPFEYRRPEPGEEGSVWLIDLHAGQRKKLATTKAWEPQLGANINWGATDEELYFNDIDVTDWSPFVVLLNPLNGKRSKIRGSVYQASQDGRYLVSSDLTLLRRTQCGYGIRIPQSRLTLSIGRSKHKGIYLIDLNNGSRTTLASIEDLTECLKVNSEAEALDDAEIYAFHTSFNRQSDKILVQLRWASSDGCPNWTGDEIRYSKIRRSFVVICLKTGRIACALPPEIEARGSHHAAWMPDGVNISLNLKLDGKNMRFCSVSWDGSNLKELCHGVRGSGHPSVHPSGGILTDTYLKAWDFPQYGDGSVPLRWVQGESGNEYVPVRINVEPRSDDPVLRVDPHPSWDRGFRYILFNGVENGTRAVFLADMSRMIKGLELPNPERYQEVQTRRGIFASAREVGCSFFRTLRSRVL